MSEKDEKVEKTAEIEKESAVSAKSSVGKGGLIVFIVIMLSLVWSLLADRFTPYTSQARVQGYVVGVAPKVAGLVTEVWVTTDQEVEEGQPLFQIDQSQYKIALEKAQFDLETAHRQVDAGSAAVEAARANLRAAKANEQKAEKDTARQEKLYKEDPGTISIRQLEVSRASLDQAQASVEEAKAQIQQTIEQKGGNDNKNNAILNTALSAVEKAQLDLTNTVVKASSRGLVTNLRADVGQFAGTGSPVLTLISMHDIWINSEFTENNLGHMHAGNSVEILFDVMPGQVFKGRVRSIGFGVDAGQDASPGTLPTIQNDRDWLRQSQRFPVIIEFDVKQSGDLYMQLRIGGQATIISYTEGQNVLNFLGKIYIRLMSWFSYAY